MSFSGLQAVNIDTAHSKRLLAELSILFLFVNIHPLRDRLTNGGTYYTDKKDNGK
jgi:hypothetical protein